MNNKNTFGANDQVVLLTTETFEGHYSAELYENRLDALRKLNRMKNSRKLSTDEALSVKYGFRTADLIAHRVVSIEEALGTEGKIIWYVHHKCFIPETYGRMDWINYFQTKEEAKAFFNDRAKLYREMVKGEPKITIMEEEDQMVILVDKKPVVYLDYLPAPVGNIVDVGMLTIPGLLSVTETEVANG